MIKKLFRMLFWCSIAVISAYLGYLLVTNNRDYGAILFASSVGSLVLAFKEKED